MNHLRHRDPVIRRLKKKKKRSRGLITREGFPPIAPLRDYCAALSPVIIVRPDLLPSATQTRDSG